VWQVTAIVFRSSAPVIERDVTAGNGCDSTWTFHDHGTRPAISVDHRGVTEHLQTVLAASAHDHPSVGTPGYTYSWS